MSVLTPETEAVLDTGARPAHLVTLRSDGRPHVTVVRTAVQDGEIVIARLREHQKVKNVRMDDRGATSVTTGSRNSYGHVRRAGFITRVTVTKIGGVGPWT